MESLPQTNHNIPYKEDVKMDKIKQYFPFAFAEKDSTKSLVISVAIQVAIAVVIGAIIGLLKAIPILGVIFGLIGSVVDIYITASVVFTLLDYFKVIK